MGPPLRSPVPGLPEISDYPLRSCIQKRVPKKAKAVPTNSRLPASGVGFTVTPSVSIEKSSDLWEKFVRCGLFPFIAVFLSTRAALIAEILFLRQQLLLFQERKERPSFMIGLAKFFDWREAPVVVKPETFVRWHRTAFRMIWRWKSRRCSRPPLPRNLRKLIRKMDRQNPRERRGR